MPCTTTSTWCTLLYNIVQPVFLYNSIYTMYNRINVVYTFFFWIQACVTIVWCSMTLNKYWTKVYNYLQLCTSIYNFVHVVLDCTIQYICCTTYIMHYVQVLKIFGTNTHNILVVVLLAVHGCTSLYNVEKGLFNIVQGCTTLYICCTVVNCDTEG